MFYCSGGQSSSAPLVPVLQRRLDASLAALTLSCSQTNATPRRDDGSSGMGMEEANDTMQVSMFYSWPSHSTAQLLDTFIPLADIALDAFVLVSRTVRERAARLRHNTLSYVFATFSLSLQLCSDSARLELAVSYSYIHMHINVYIYIYVYVCLYIYIYLC